MALPALALEYSTTSHPSQLPSGMVLLPDESSPLAWQGIWFVHQDYYAGAILKFNIVFPPNYPSESPSFYFISPIFHPLVRSDGLFNLEPVFREWRPNEHKVLHILYWIKSCFTKKGLDKIAQYDSWNQEAYQYHDPTGLFAKLAAQESVLSQTSAALQKSDHPSLAGQQGKGILFPHKPQKEVKTLRRQLSLSSATTS